MKCSDQSFKRTASRIHGFKWLAFGAVSAFLTFSSNPIYSKSNVAAGTHKVGSAIPYADRTDVTDLLLRYSSYLDERNHPQEFADLFTDDGEISAPESDFSVKGREALLRFAVRPRDIGWSVHFVGAPLLVQVSPTIIKAKTTVVMGLRNQVPQGSASFLSYSIYEDTIVKTKVGWKFSLRRSGQTLPVSPDFVW